jgi:MOSC domain-containing protein YiiM
MSVVGRTGQNREPDTYSMHVRENIIGKPGWTNKTSSHIRTGMHIRTIKPGIHKKDEQDLYAHKDNKTAMHKSKNHQNRYSHKNKQKLNQESLTSISV